MAIAAVGGFGASAFAQDTLPVQKPIRVKLGGVFTGNKVDAVGTSDNISYLFNVGVAYDFSKTTATQPLIVNAYADFNTGSKSKNTGAFGNVKATATNFDIGVAGRYLLTPATAPGGHPYAELGIGLYNIGLKIDQAGFGSKTKNEVKLGGKLALGYEMTNGLFGEFEYTLVDKLKKDFYGTGVNTSYDPSGLKASLGFRF